QSCLQRLRQTRRLVACTGDGVCARSRFPSTDYTERKTTSMKRVLLVTGIVLLAISSICSQTRNRVEPLPKLLSVREQQALRETWLRKRLDTMLLPLMRQQKIDMWIVTNEEFHADPVTEYIAPPLPYVGRRDYFIFA